MEKNLRRVVWFLVAIFGCIFTMTVFFTLETAPRIGWLVIIPVCALQVAGLLYYLHAKPETKPSGLRKTVLVLLHLSSLGVVVCFAFSAFCLASEYHNPVAVTGGTETGEHITIEETDDLYIMYPTYTTVEFTAGSRPNRGDGSINFCCSAAFQKTYNLSFESSELPGTYVLNGKKIIGYELDGLGAFSFYEGSFHFANQYEAEAEIERTAQAGGTAFRQYLVIDDGEVTFLPSDEYRCLRVLAELEGQLCVIDTKIPMRYEAFIDELLAIGVEHAMFMDMGSGWNYSWYRDNYNQTNTLIGMYWPFSHNWLVFKSE